MVVGSWERGAVECRFGASTVSGLIVVGEGDEAVELPVHGLKGYLVNSGRGAEGREPEPAGLELNGFSVTRRVWRKGTERPCQSHRGGSWSCQYGSGMGKVYHGVSLQDAK